MATTLYRSKAMIYSLLATLTDAKDTSGAPLDDVITQVDILRLKIETNPSALTEAELVAVEEMVSGFLAQSFYNIRRFFRDLDSTNTEPLEATLADGSAIADGSAKAS